MERPPHSILQGDMQRLADGDRAAFRPVFDSLWPLLRSYAARHLPPGEAEDAAQEALVKIFHRASEFDPARSAMAWALGIATWEIRTILRRRRRRREETLPQWNAAPDPSPGPEESAMLHDLESMMRDALGALRPEDAETLRLYALGERAAVTPATFRKRVQRALERLRAVWRINDGSP